MKKFLVMCLAVLAFVNVTVYADTQEEKLEQVGEFNFWDENIHIIKDENGEYKFDNNAYSKKDKNGKFMIYNGEMYGDIEFLDDISIWHFKDEGNGIYSTDIGNSNIGVMNIKINSNANRYEVIWKGMDGEVNSNESFHNTSFTIGKNTFRRNVMKRIKSENPIINKDGVTYFPIKEICELVGKNMYCRYDEEDNSENIEISRMYINDSYDHWDNELEYFYRTGEFNAKSSKEAKIKINVKFPYLTTSASYISVMNGLLRIEAERYAESIYKQYANSETDVKINAELNWVYGKNDIISIEYGIKGKPETYFGKSIYASDHSDKYGITNIYDYIEDCKLEYIFCKNNYDSFETPIAPLAAINHVFIRDDEDKYILNLAKNKLKEEINKNPDKYYENAAEIIDKSDFNGQLYLKNGGVAIFCKPGEVADKALGYIRAELKENEISMTENPLEGVYRYYTDSAINYYVFDKDGKSYTYMTTMGSTHLPDWQYRIEDDTFYVRTIGWDILYKKTYTKTDDGFILNKGTEKEIVFKKLDNVDASNFRILNFSNAIYIIRENTDYLKNKKISSYTSSDVEGESFILNVLDNNENIVFRAKVNAVTGECINLENNEKINLWDFKK